MVTVVVTGSCHLSPAGRGGWSGRERRRACPAAWPSAPPAPSTQGAASGAGGRSGGLLSLLHQPPRSRTPLAVPARRRAPRPGCRAGQTAIQRHGRAHAGARPPADGEAVGPHRRAPRPARSGRDRGLVVLAALPLGRLRETNRRRAIALSRLVAEGPTTQLGQQFEERIRELPP